MKDRTIILIALLIIILQTTLLQLFSFADIIPNVMLVWVVVVAALFDKNTSLKTAIYSGILFDIIGGKGLGVHFTIYLSLSLLIIAIEDKIFKDNYITPLILLTLSSLFSYVFTAFVYYFATGRFLLLTRFFSHFLPEMAYNIIVGLLLYSLVIKYYTFDKDR